MMLVKNSAGFNRSINLIAHDEGNYKLAFLLNDRFADGTDISWIWDVDFEALADQQVRFTRVLVSGVRADDMARVSSTQALHPSVSRLSASTTSC